MEIGKDYLTLTYQRILRFNGFFDLHNHVSLRIDILDGRHNLRTGLHVGFVAEATALPCSMLYEDLMSVSD